MNPIVEEMMAIYTGKELMHIGMPRRSGRYPWGSGDNPYQHSIDFIGRVEEMRKNNFTYTDENGKTWTGDNAIAKSMGLTSSQFRTELGVAKDERRMLNVARARSLKEDGLNDSQIGRAMGVNESTVRSWLDPNTEARMNQAKKTADFLREQVNKKEMVDVGTGVERELNISKEKLNQALYLLEKEGYVVYGGRFSQVTNKGQMTTQKVLCKPGTEHKEIYNLDKVKTLTDYVSHDGGDTFDKFVYPKSMDSKRLMIRYKEDGGIDKDGIIELRRNVDDLSLGENRYCQVRILVDNKKYIKGMAIYSDDMPPGVDVVFNTNKTKNVSKMDVLKDIKSDPDNPFGALIKAGGQSYYIDKNGNRQLSLINATRTEGDWTDWKDALPSQFLSKQSKTLAKRQLNLAKEDKRAEFDEICSLTNPTIKKHYLSKFADECDSAAVHLQAAALPGQKYHVIIPITSMKDNEVYAPRYENGTKLALIRYPHGGTFEIPILTVNNKQSTAKKLLGTDATDAVGINSKVAERLSGADFDGDTVMCIPTHDSKGKVKIASTPPLKGLEGFDPKTAYPERPGMKYMKKTDTEMGKISNLITDMTLAGASQDELARAVRHSMVVIDAEKHKLDYKQSELDNNIAALRKKYQAHTDSNGKVRYGGASTLISRSKGEHDVIKRQGTPKVNMKGKEWYDPSRPEGALIYKTADDASYTIKKINKRTGEEIEVTKYRTQKSTNMAETDDAYSLVSDSKHPMELIYADYANSMKALANKARKEEMMTGKIAYSSEAKKKYKKEVDSLLSKLNTAELNTVRERAAQRMANAEISRKKEANPDAKNKDIKKWSQQSLTKYRNEVGSIARRDRSIVITDDEWKAIQAGAISESKLKRILNNSDADSLRERAMPKTSTGLSDAKIRRIKSMKASDYSLNEIAKALGVSTSTVSNYLKGVN
jgi:DNA-binding CsgD family transcriptional regulator